MSLANLIKGWAAAEEHGHDDSHLGPSALGSACLRRDAFNLHGIKGPDGQDHASAATVGTALHAWVAEIAEAAGLEAEVPVQVPALRRMGKADVIDRKARVVWDTKTLGRMRFDSWINRDGPPEEVWQQAGLYVLGVCDGEDGWQAGVLALCRDTGRMKEWIRPVDLLAMREVAWDLVEREDELLSKDPMLVPRGGTSSAEWPCRGCSHASVCHDDALFDQVPAPPEDLSPARLLEVEAAIDTYQRAAEEEKAAKQRKQQAREVLLGVAGRIGSWTLGWSGGVASEKVDADAAVEMLRSLGHEPPTKTVRSAQRISLKRLS